MSSFGCANPSTCPYGGRCDNGCSITTMTPTRVRTLIQAPKFSKGDRVDRVNLFTNTVKTTGTIDYLRDDTWERQNNHPQGNYNYSVTYDDGSFETYASEACLRHHK